LCRSRRRRLSLSALARTQWCQFSRRTPKRVEEGRDRFEKKPGGRAKGETDNRKVNEEKEAQTGVHRRAAVAAGDIISKAPADSRREQAIFAPLNHLSLSGRSQKAQNTKQPPNRSVSALQHSLET